jgi:addiction module HigA family antidote
MVKQNQYFPQSRPHPGVTLAEKLEELGMGPKEFSVRTGKPEKTIIAILSGESSITADMAVQFENVLRIPAHFWLNSQKNYDEYKAREKRHELLEQSVEWMTSFPVLDMIKKGWIKAAKSPVERAQELLSFFGFSSPDVWEKYYYGQQLKVAFRISLAHTKEPHALSAWLRQGDLQAAELQTPAYDEKKFKTNLEKIKSLMATHPNDFFNQLQQLCLEAGVKVVHTPCLPKAPISGSTRWLNEGNPLIQLSGRYKRNDSFWFTFFHEAGHILLHGKKDIFLESVDYNDKDLAKEAQADQFAVKWTFSEQQEEELLQIFEITEDDIVRFANNCNTHPAMIIGRLQKKGLIHYSVGRQFIVPIDLTENDMNR